MATELSTHTNRQVTVGSGRHPQDGLDKKTRSPWFGAIALYTIAVSAYAKE